MDPRRRVQRTSSPGPLCPRPVALEASTASPRGHDAQASRGRTAVQPGLGRHQGRRRARCHRLPPGLCWAKGGLLGVGVFFVLSGYLITDLLVVEDGRRGIALGRFWVRRARRLLPALFVMFLVVIAWATLLDRANPRRFGEKSYRPSSTSALVVHLPPRLVLHPSAPFGARTPVVPGDGGAVLSRLGHLRLAGTALGHGPAGSWSSARSMLAIASASRWRFSSRRSPTRPGSTTAPTPGVRAPDRRRACFRPSQGARVPPTPRRPADSRDGRSGVPSGVIALYGVPASTTPSSTWGYGPAVGLAPPHCRVRLSGARADRAGIRSGPSLDG